MRYFAARKTSLCLLAGLGGGVTTLATILDTLVKAELSIHPPKLPWNHNGPLDSLDHGSIRRGYQVYKEVCSACHSMKFLAFRNLVGVCYTEEEVKKMRTTSTTSSLATAAPLQGSPSWRTSTLTPTSWVGR